MHAPSMLQAPRRIALRLRVVRAGVLVIAGLTAAASHAQAPVCGQIRAELASLGSGGGNSGGAEAARLRVDLARVRVALQQNDCNSRGFLGFGGPAPVCSPLKAQAGQIEARLRQVQGGPNSARRAELIAALDRYNCLGGQPPQQRGVIYAAPQAPSLFEQLFGSRPGVRVDEPPGLPPDPDAQALAEPKERLGGRLAICVRTCDGFYFPVNFEGISARDEHDAVCEALCPGSETQVFFMRAGGDVSLAATRSGQPYTALPNALKYREKFDSSCFCKQPGMTWAQASQGAVDIVEARKGDLIVTPEQAEAMSRPKADQPPQRARNAKAAAKTPEPAEPAPVPESALPTGGTASAGIGPKASSQVVVPADQGKTQSVIGADGVRRQVRVVAPGLASQEPLPSLRGAARP